MRMYAAKVRVVTLATASILTTSPLKISPGKESMRTSAPIPSVTSPVLSVGTSATM